MTPILGFAAAYEERENGGTRKVAKTRIESHLIQVLRSQFRELRGKQRQVSTLAFMKESLIKINLNWLLDIRCRNPIDDIFIRYYEEKLVVKKRVLFCESPLDGKSDLAIHRAVRKIERITGRSFPFPGYCGSTLGLAEKAIKK
jgi:hypothetical protein